MKTKLVFIAITFTYAALALFDQKWSDGRTPIASDPAAYYYYLPFLTLHHDRDYLNDSTIIAQHLASTGYVPETWFLVNGPNKQTTTKVAMGVAMMELPGFILATAYYKLTGQNTCGYEYGYKLMFVFSNVFFSLLGLFYLFKVLKRHFSEKTSLITITAIGVCTNFLFYSVWYTGMAHNYSFFLISLLIYLLPNYHRQSGLKHMIAWSILGLLTLVRPTNLLFGLLFLLYDAPSFTLIKQRILSHLKKPVYPILFFMIPIMLQLIFWKMETGRWLFYSYTGEKFNFLDPHIINGLFGFRKGLFVYSPVLLFAILGFFFIYKDKITSYYYSLPFFLLFSYIIFSWWSWWYGGGLGSRAMIDFFPLLSFPLAITIERITRTQMAYYIVVLLLFCTFSLNLLQSYQYKKGIVHYSEMNFKAYMFSLGRVSYNESEKKQFEKLIEQTK